MTKKTFELSADDKRLGLHLVAGKGSGNSRFLGRILAFDNVTINVPTVIIDPTGAAIDNLLDRIGCIPDVKQRGEILARIRYIDIAGRRGFVMPQRMYYPASKRESFNDMAMRFVEMINRTDRSLAEAPIQGANAITYIGRYVGIIRSWLPAHRGKCTAGRPLEVERQVCLPTTAIPNP